MYAIVYGVDKGGMGNVIPRSLQTLRTEVVAAGVASQTSKLSERRSSTTNRDPGPGSTAISTRCGKRSDMRDPDDMFEKCWSPHDTGEADSVRNVVQRQPVLLFFEVAPVSREQKRFPDGSRN